MKSSHPEEAPEGWAANEHSLSSGSTSISSHSNSQSETSLSPSSSPVLPLTHFDKLTLGSLFLFKKAFLSPIVITELDSGYKLQFCLKMYDERRITHCVELTIMLHAVHYSLTPLGLWDTNYPCSPFNGPLSFQPTKINKWTQKLKKKFKAKAEVTTENSKYCNRENSLNGIP